MMRDIGDLTLTVPQGLLSLRKGSRVPPGRVRRDDGVHHLSEHEFDGV